MPQNLTHNPSTLKVGDKVWILKTTNSIHKLEHEKIPRTNANSIMKPIPCTIIKITQTLKENNKDGTGGPRKRMFEYHLMPLCVDTTSEPIYATHKANLFHTLQDLNKWITDQIKQWNKTSTEHDKRHEEIKDIIYIND